MINEDFTMEWKEAKTYDPIPADVYQVELVDITLKTALSYDKTRDEKVMDFQFTLLEGKDGEKELRGRNVWRNFVPTFFYSGRKGDNVAMQIAQAFIGRKLTMEDVNWSAKEWNSLIGKQCRVVIENTTKDDKTYSNIKSFLPARGVLPALTADELESVKVKPTEYDQNDNQTQYPERQRETTEIGQEPLIDVKDIPF